MCPHSWNISVSSCSLTVSPFTWSSWSMPRWGPASSTSSRSSTSSTARRGLLIPTRLPQAHHPRARALVRQLPAHQRRSLPPVLRLQPLLPLLLSLSQLRVPTLHPTAPQARPQPPTPAQTPAPALLLDLVNTNLQLLQVFILWFILAISSLICCIHWMCYEL